MKMTKTVFRARLTTENLRSRLAVCLLTPDDYDPTEAVRYWYEQTSRRERYPKESTKEEEEMDDEEWGGPSYLADEDPFEDVEIQEKEFDAFFERLCGNEDE